MKFKDAAPLLVDIQNDLCPGGSLAVKDGEKVCGPVNRLMREFKLVIATQDWHPRGHCSFKEQGGLWPEHCVQGTRGAELYPAIDRHAADLIFRKGEQAERDAYSAFEGRDEKNRLLHRVLKRHKVSTLCVAGLATDVCVRTTVLDALELGYQVIVVTDAIRAVDESAGTKALEEISKKGARLRESGDLLG
jgi:nicotinamidase/pyrazinamidase